MADEIENVEVEQPSSTWEGSLSDDIADHPLMKNVKDVSDLATQYINAQGLIGRSVQIPSDDASEEQWGKFNERIAKVRGVYRMPSNDAESNDLWSKLGKPDNTEGYELSDNAFAEAAHAANLTKDQATTLSKWIEDAASKMETESNTNSDNQLDLLKDEWGRAYDARIGQAQNAVRYMDEKVEGLFDYLNDSGMGNNPQIIKLFYLMSQGLKEPTMNGQPTATMTSKEAMARAHELTEKLFDLDEIDPRRQGVIDERAKYFEMAMGSA